MFRACQDRAISASLKAGAEKEMAQPVQQSLIPCKASFPQPWALSFGYSEGYKGGRVVQLLGG